MKKSMLMFLCVSMISVTVFAGGNRADGGTAAGDRIHIMIPLFRPEAPSQNAPLWAGLERLTGERLDIQFVPSDSYNERLNITIAANELPHAFCVIEHKSNSFVSAAAGGMFWELGDAIRNAPNLSMNLDAAVLVNASTNGRNYLIPRTRITTRSAYNYRKDWLEQLGLQAPETLTDIYNIIRAFATQNPGGAGNSFGLITAANDEGIWGLSIVAVTNGAGNGYIEQNGQLVPSFSTPQYFETLQFFKRLYDERLINQDFATIRQERGFELLNAEQGGMYFGNSDEIVSRFEPLLNGKRAANPNIELQDLWDFNARIRSSDGVVRIPGGVGFYGGFVFPRTRLRTEAEFQRVFNIFDKFDSDEGRNLIQWGIEGVHFSYNNGIAQQIMTPTFQTDVGTFWQLGVTYSTNSGSIRGVLSPMQERTRSDQIVNQRYAIMDLTYPFISPTFVSRNAELRSIIADATIQYVMGHINEAGYWAAVERWRASGGQQIIDEYTQAFITSR